MKITDTIMIRPYFSTSTPYLDSSFKYSIIITEVIMSVHESSMKGSIEKNIETRDAKVSTSTLYLNFSFYKIYSKWRWLNDIGETGK